MAEKQDIRKKMLTIRSSLSQEDRQKASMEICRRIAALEVYQEAMLIYGYMPIRGEADVTFLLEQAFQDGKEVALPRVAGETMEFYRVAALSEVEEGAFHVPEPLRSCPQIAQDGLVLVPGAAFDRNGGRIGYGKGYYDRYFSNHGQRLYKLGIGYNFQIVEEVPMTELDVPLDAVLTELG